GAGLPTGNCGRRVSSTHIQPTSAPAFCHASTTESGSGLGNAAGGGTGAATPETARPHEKAMSTTANLRPVRGSADILALPIWCVTTPPSLNARPAPAVGHPVTTP